MSLLKVDDVVVQFGGVTAVNHASFEVESGSVTGLIGPNGAGKTTCFNVITGLQRPTSGRVLLNGKDVTSLGVPRRARLGMGRTFQRLEAFGSLTVRDNVRTALDIHAGVKGLFKPTGVKQADQLLERVGISEYAEERADAIPTGTARLLELARALACRPRLLLLDEPSSGLDESETGAFGDLLLELADEGRTVLMVEHDMELVMAVCHRINVLDFGSIIAEGSPAQIRSDPVVQKAYLGYSEEPEVESPAERTDELPVITAALLEESPTQVLPAVQENAVAVAPLSIPPPTPARQTAPRRTAPRPAVPRPGRRPRPVQDDDQTPVVRG